MSVFLLSSSSSCALVRDFHFSQWKLKEPLTNPLTLSKERRSSSSSGGSCVRLANYHRKGKIGVKAFFFNPIDEPILKEALKEPVAFMGGMFAGLLRLDLKEEPLKEWIERTVEASGVTEEEIDAEGSKPEEVPQQIEIE
ncbi:UPF0426 protein At1g28150, chloroplastic isoform X1 [Juglans microcarpa x Juglans regia]|uniref:UPF0426 protein At1g28150, chloroplastic isoform X1 n=1 Tax=Juglans microcarpa x Juglans regia TaxID=2249226 RepID=UPI001B7EAD9B|nr:UPF0426 protein At1g28150, chloroplastic isoform X1 [Juglans microcarpa x Juglans regia]